MSEKTNPIALLEGKSDDETVWVENMLEGKSVFHGRDDNKYEMESHGNAGSIISVQTKVLRGDSYLLRKLGDGKIRLLTEEDAVNRQSELFAQELEDESDMPTNIAKALQKGASDAGSRYAIEVSDDGSEQGTITDKDVWAKTNRASASSPQTVRRSGTASADEPVELPEVEITAPVKEGEWTPDTGV